MPRQTPNIVNVAIGVLVQNTGGAARVLIARRPDDTVYAGYWEFPGGKLHDGESPPACLAREFHEELGIDVQVRDPLPVIEHVYDHAHVRLHPFYCAMKSGEPFDPGAPGLTAEPRNLQVAEHRWIAPPELLDYRFPEANAPLIARIMADLGC